MRILYKHIYYLMNDFFLNTETPTFKKLSQRKYSIFKINELQYNVLHYNILYSLGNLKKGTQNWGSVLYKYYVIYHSYISELGEFFKF